MGRWERFNENIIPIKKPFYSELYLEDINYEDYTHVKKIFEEFKLKNRDLFVQNNTLLLADKFENFRKKCTEIYEIDPTHFLSAPRLA